MNNNTNIIIYPVVPADRAETAPLIPIEIHVTREGIVACYDGEEDEEYTSLDELEVALQLSGLIDLLAVHPHCLSDARRVLTEAELVALGLHAADDDGNDQD